MADFATWKEKNKALWTRVYDELIAPDFEEEWARREEKLTKDLKQEEEHQQALMNPISSEKANLDENPKKQNGILASPSRNDGHNASEGTISIEEYRNLSDKFNDLVKKYQDVSQKVKYLEKKNAAVMQKNRDMKESVRAWQDYVNRRSGKQKAKNETNIKEEQTRLLNTRQLHDNCSPVHAHQNPVTPAPVTASEHTTDASIAPFAPTVSGSFDWLTSPKSSPLQDDRSSNASLTPKALPPGGQMEWPRRESDDLDHGLVEQNRPFDLKDTRNLGRHLYSINQGSSQTTEDESAEHSTRNQQIMDTGSEEDIPQFVSARSLKRKRGQSSKAKFEVFTDHGAEGTPERPFRVKEEQLSSPPIDMYKLTRTEPVDLDDPTPNVLRTPRHPRRKISAHSNAMSTLRNQRPNSAPFTQEIKRENFTIATGFPDLPPGLEGTQAMATEVRAHSEPSDHNQNGVPILQPIDPNTLAGARSEPLTKRLKQARLEQEAGYHTFAESDEVAPPAGEDHLRLPPRMVRAQFNRQLQALKNPQPTTKGFKETPKPGFAKTETKQSPTLPSDISPSIRGPLYGDRSRAMIPNSRSTPRAGSTLDDRPIWVMTDSEPRSSGRQVRTRPLRGVKRLRGKALPELSVTDFKPNPAYNQGYSYAFSETVRKRGDRMCLPGCTNPQCCGSTFRAFAQAQAPLPASQEEALLEDYLGDAYDQMQVTQMTFEEREELILQARTRKMANESGKHREGYERRRTPPGFWRVDFPTTQEQQEDREKAREQERKIVHERWLEAQREGGRWIFRDE